LDSAEFELVGAIARQTAGEDSGPAPEHDAGASAEPYAGGTLLTAQKVRQVTGLVRGLDRLLFDQ
jgi:hypothetical protein